MLALQSISVFALIAIPPDTSTLAQKKPIPPPAAQPVATPSPAVEQAIELPQIAARAEELDRSLREMSERLAPDPALNSIDQSLREQEASMRERQRQTDELIAASPTIVELKDAEQDWRAAKERCNGWRRLLTERIKAVETDARSLTDQQALWSATLDRLRGTNPIEAVLDRVRTVINEIQSTKSKANRQLTFFVTLQNSVSQQDQALTDVLDKIGRARAELERSLLDRDSLPLWKAASTEVGDQSTDASLRRAVKRASTHAQEFLNAHRRTVFALFIFFIVTLGINLILRRDVIRDLQAESSRAAHLFRHPISLALLASLIVALPLVSTGAPALVRSLLIILFMAPVLRFLPALISPAARPLLYLLVGFGLTVGIWEILAVGEFVKREITALLSLAAILAAVWLMRPSRINILESSERRGSLVVIASSVTLLLITGSLLANLLGYVGLSRVLRGGTIHSAYFAVILYTAFIATTSIFSRIWRSEQDSHSPHWEMIAKWCSRILGIAAVLLWFYASLNFFNIRESVLDSLSSVLTSPIRLGTIAFSLGDVLTFVLVFVLGLVLANIIRVVLQMDVLPRLPLKRGLPYAISTITYYVLLLAVFLMALAASGVELSRFTLLTGAFGVGAGFGLQNIINNFFSGIILLFERPIRIGDSLEIDNLTGDVERIGMRSTTLRTSQGAEVIVPNSLLISGRVTNWTLGKPHRRGELKVEVSSDIEAERARDLLAEIANSQEGVLRDPKPAVYLTGFGGNTLNYELQFWMPHAAMLMQVRSELTLRIAAALRALSQEEMKAKSLNT
ncbi:MAG: mechanosensitive ion channel [Blastocatellia bacterium]|nr:mechanosensitive ion channel [Blastocatellia bacterium]